MMSDQDHTQLNENISKLTKDVGEIKESTLKKGNTFLKDYGALILALFGVVAFIFATGEGWVHFNQNITHTPETTAVKNDMTALTHKVDMQGLILININNKINGAIVDTAMLERRDKRLITFFMSRIIPTNAQVSKLERELKAAIVKNGFNMIRVDPNDPNGPKRLVPAKSN